jgi:hypothetical protein
MRYCRGRNLIPLSKKRKIILGGLAFWHYPYEMMEQGRGMIPWYATFDRAEQ